MPFSWSVSMRRPLWGADSCRWSRRRGQLPRQRRVFAPATGEDTLALGQLAPHPDHQLDARDELRRFDLSLRRICSGQSRVVYLHDVLGYRLSDIARAMGISVAAAQSRLIRGRRAMLKELGGTKRS